VKADISNTVTIPKIGQNKDVDLDALAYRWQVELIFRFLKRTMGGIHLINNFEWGVTIQFYVLLIVALLELNLKQQAVAQQEEKEQSSRQDTNNQSAQDNETTPADSSPSDHESSESSDKELTHPYQFFQMIGEELQKYWKIGIHWLSALRSILHLPFDEHVIEILGTC